MTAVKKLETTWEFPEHKSVYEALCAAQLEFGTVVKGAVNPAFKSRYADLSDVASVVIPTLNRHGVAVFHRIAGDAMETVFHHASSATEVSCAVPLIVDRSNAHGFKSAVTYAKRIGLESLSGVAPEDDDGNAAAAAPPLQTINGDQLETLQNLMGEIPNLNVDGFLGYMGVSALKDLPNVKYKSALAALENKKKRGV